MAAIRRDHRQRLTDHSWQKGNKYTKAPQVLHSRFYVRVYSISLTSPEVFQKRVGLFSRSQGAWFVGSRLRLHTGGPCMPHVSGPSLIRVPAVQPGSRSTQLISVATWNCTGRIDFCTPLSFYNASKQYELKTRGYKHTDAPPIHKTPHAAFRQSLPVLKDCQVLPQFWKIKERNLITKTRTHLKMRFLHETFFSPQKRIIVSQFLHNVHIGVKVTIL